MIEFRNETIATALMIGSVLSTDIGLLLFSGFSGFPRFPRFSVIGKLYSQLKSVLTKAQEL